MNSSQLTLIREAKRILEDCACFRGPQGETGPQGATGATGPVGPAGTITDFTIPGASTNSLMYYTGTGFGAMSSLFYYSSINTLQANLDIIPCTDNIYNLGASNERWLNIYASNYNGIENYNYISTSGLTSTVAGLGTIGYVSSSQLTSTVTGLNRIFNSTILTTGFGKTLRVDSIYGNDTLALVNQYNFPFSTISCAMHVASTNDCIYLLPGNYNEQVIFKPGVNIRGISLNSVSIQKLNVTSDTTLVKMNTNTRLEDITLNLTSTTPLASTLIGVSFSSCQTSAKIRTAVINVNNSGLLSNTVPTNLYGIYSSGHSSTIYSSFDELQRTTVNVIGTGTGKKRALYNDDSNKFSCRDVNLFCANTYNTTFVGGNYIAVETNNKDSVIQIKTSSVSGSNYNSDVSADISQTQGTIIVAYTDLVNKEANNLGLTIASPQQLFSFGVTGSLSNKPGQGGTTWENSYLVPGTLSFTGNAGEPIRNYYSIRTPVVSLLTTFTFQAATGPGIGPNGTISSFAILSKNGTILPQFSLNLVGGQSTLYLSTSTIRLGANDNFGVYLSTSSSNTDMTYPVINLSLY